MGRKDWPPGRRVDVSFLLLGKSDSLREGTGVVDPALAAEDFKKDTPLKVEREVDALEKRLPPSVLDVLAVEARWDWPLRLRPLRASVGFLTTMDIVVFGDGQTLPSSYFH